MAAVEFRVLGTVGVSVDGHAQHLRPMEQLVLAVLLAEHNRLVSVDALVDRVWRGDPPRTAATALRVHIDRLRSTMRRGDVSRLVTGEGGYRLVVERDELDSLRFEDSLRRGRTTAEANPLAASQILRDGLGEWNGEPFPAIDGIESIDMTRTYLERRRGELLVELAQVELAAGRHTALVADVRSWSAEFPDSEALASALVLAEYRSGDPVAALADCRAFQEKFADQYGLDASRAFRTLETALLRQDPALDPPSPSASVGEPPPLGRGRLIQRIRDLVDGGHPPRLIDLAGPRGMGATTVAEFLRRSRPRTALLRPGPRSLDALLSTAGIDGATASPDLPVLVAKALRDRHIDLLVVDGADELAPDLVVLLTGLLRAFDEVTVLTTGRRKPLTGHPLTTELSAASAVGIELEALSPEASRELVEGLVPPSVDARDEAVATVLDAGGGDPFLLTSLARHIVSSDAAAGVPASVGQFVRATLTALPEDCRSVLRHAAVDQAAPLDLAVLAQTTGLGSEVTAAWVEQALAAGLLRPGGAGVQFRHPLVRDAILASVDPMELARLSAALAQVRSVQAHPDLGATARLWRAAGPEHRSEAAQWTFQEAHAEGRRGAHLRAAELFAEVVDFAGQTDGAERLLIEAALAQAEELILAGQLVAAQRVALDAADLARAARQDDLFARAALVVAGPWLPLGTEAHRAQQHLAEALDYVDPADRAVRVKLLEGLIRTSTGGDLRYRMLPPEFADELTSAAADRSDPETAASALRALHYLSWAERRPPTYRQDVAARMALAARRSGNGGRYVDALRVVATSAFETADPLAAMVGIERYREEAAEAGSALHGWWSATMNLVLGELAGETSQTAARAVEAAAGFMEAEALTQIELERMLSGAVRTGRLAELTPLLESLREPGPAGITHADPFVALTAQAVQVAGGGPGDPARIGQAWAALRASLRGGPAAALATTILRQAGPGVLPAHLRDDLVAELEPLSDGWLFLTVAGALGPVDSYLAWLYQSAGDSAGAARHHQRAEAVIARFAPTWRGFSLVQTERGIDE